MQTDEMFLELVVLVHAHTIGFVSTHMLASPKSFYLRYLL
jgi:hypothetical protein